MSLQLFAHTDSPSERLGALWRVPEVPAHYLKRTEEMAAIVAALGAGPDGDEGGAAMGIASTACTT